MVKQERRLADRYELLSMGCAIVKGENVEFKVRSISKKGALIEFPAGTRLKEGALMRMNLEAGFIGRVRIVRVEEAEECVLCGIQFDRFEFTSERALNGYICKHEQDARVSNHNVANKSDFLIREYYQTKVIFHENAPGDTAYIIRQGKVGISKVVNGKKAIVTVLGPGSIFGELALMTKGQQRTATAEALEKTEVIEISKDKFDKFMGQTPTVIASILNALSKRIVDVTAAMVQKDIQLKLLQQKSSQQ
jgi:hypothetical protein